MRKTFSPKRRFSPSRFITPVVPLTSAEIKEIMKDTGAIIGIEKMNELIKESIEKGLNTVSFIWYKDCTNNPGEFSNNCYNYYVDDSTISILKRSGYDVYVNRIHSRYVSINLGSMLG